MLFSRSLQRNLLKLLSLFSLVRGYNIVILVIAQYLTARYILSPKTGWWDLVFDLPFFCIVAASALTTAAGYIINNFYDAAKDQINRPKKYILEHLVSQQLQLVFYLLLNMIGLVFSSVVSFRAVLFFLFYMLSIWLYSSGIKRLFWLSNLFSALLMIFPFWGITLYLKNFETVIFYHAAYLFFLILARDIVKDLENFKGDWVQRYKTLPTVFSVPFTKTIITLVVLLCFIPSYYLIHESLGLMQYFFIAGIPFLGFVLIFLWRAQDQKAYLWTHNLIKFWILIGVLSIALVYQNL
ncbi:geranylgeranylglycerol-phosphate geranylgeranyltransferase [Flavobacteriaceae bacterium]|jgi:4-hydroxybenzoate polyprenyltransferase|nr:geranylgeranylglycerol-phosphate geranylgeranyltransferase [Flavobacteriaceae bacterium]MDA7808206.1 geranylgeranylglycerol-phosphate geranylgeranyltransferase [Flavobacteriaceae bacterium]MDA8643719.1 geranylgeranylglycerol-phosphate geranylgeranyltransferase [Flavobacteriaceae bacterium]MDA8877776.1 geranylgeranylglycerol-phosphate geranylgeranyltransferase [Flavobacteriaceae bacterium]MDA9038213.1 geranylgeranylglycerol-phosphate geranylgeranyltransferase [Flavobacteriaceae bacterium]